MDDAAKTFSAQEAAAAQLALRQAMGLGPEAFPLTAFVGMISDEIEQLRAAGRSDGDIAATIKAATGRDVTPAEIAEHYAAPEDRRPGGYGP